MLGAKLEPTRRRARQQRRWLPALALLCQMLEATLEPNIRYSIRTRACEKGRRQPAQAPLCETG